MKLFQNRVTEDASKKNYHAIQREASQIAYKEWMDFVADNAAFDEFRKCLRNWNSTAIEYEPGDQELDAWSEQTARNVQRAEVLFEFARRVWETGDRSRAKSLFREAFEYKDPDGQPGGIVASLKKKIGVDVLDDIRREVLEDLESSD